MFQRKKKRQLVGLDIGSHTIKMMRVKEGKSGPKVLNFGLATVPPGAFAEGRIKEPEAIALTIQKLAKHLKITEKAVAVSISGYDVMIKKIELPVMTQEELDVRMTEQLGQYIPYSTDEVNVDYQMLDAVRDRPKNMEVLLVAAKKDSINDYLDLLIQAGLDPLVVDVDCFALSNAHEIASGGDRKDNVALVDIGASKSSVYMVSERGVPVFTRDLSMGGGQITELIQNRFRISYPEAERVKLGESSERVDVHELEDIFTTVAQSWVSEVKHVIDFFYNNYPDSHVGRIFLSGGSSRIPGLDKLFNKHTSVEVEVFNPLTRLECDPGVFDPSYIQYVGPQMAISLGLAIRKTNEK